MIPYRHVVSQFYNQPLLLTPDAAETISTLLQSRMQEMRAGGGIELPEHDSGRTTQMFDSRQRADGSIEVHSPRASRFYGDFPLDADNRPMPFRRTADGTAILTLVGEWVNRGAWVGASSGLISYEGFAYQMRRAAADPKTRSIVLDFQSPGGQGVGAFETAALVREVAQVKPVVAFVNGLMGSAAYGIGSAASRIVTIPSGISGSIGVVLMHLDMSAWLAKEGVKPTLIFAGDHKVDGNPYEPLPKDVREDFQARVNAMYDQFVATVAQGRGMDEKAVRGTQARVFSGPEAVAAGLADDVGTFDDVLREMGMPARSGRTTGASMKTDQGAPGAETAGSTTTTTTAPAAADLQKASADGAAAAQTRIKAILGATEAQGRGKLAHHLAFETAMTADAATAVLAASPKEQAEPKASRMGTPPSPNVTPAAPATDAQQNAASWDDVVTKVNAETAANSGGRPRIH